MTLIHSRPFPVAELKYEKHDELLQTGCRDAVISARVLRDVQSAEGGDVKTGDGQLHSARRLDDRARPLPVPGARAAVSPGRHRRRVRGHPRGAGVRDSEVGPRPASHALLQYRAVRWLHVIPR